MRSRMPAWLTLSARATPARRMTQDGRASLEARGWGLSQAGVEEEGTMLRSPVESLNPLSYSGACLRGGAGGNQDTSPQSPTVSDFTGGMRGTIGAARADQRGRRRAVYGEGGVGAVGSGGRGLQWLVRDQSSHGANRLGGALVPGDSAGAGRTAFHVRGRWDAMGQSASSGRLSRRRIRQSKRSGCGARS